MISAGKLTVHSMACVLAVVVAMNPASASSEEMQIISELITRQLAGFQVYAIDPHTTSNSRLIARKNDGSVVELGYEQDISARPLIKTRLIAFLADQRIPVSSAKDAVDVVRLIRYIVEAPNRSRMIRVNTRDYTRYDEQVYQAFTCSDRYWEHSATRSPKGWTVVLSYTGPPADTMEPPTYLIEVDSDSNFQTLAVRDPIRGEGWK